MGRKWLGLRKGHEHLCSSSHPSVVVRMCLHLSRFTLSQDSSDSFLLFFLQEVRRRLFLHKDTPHSEVGRRFTPIAVNRKCVCTPSLHPTTYSLILFPSGGVTPSPISVPRVRLVPDVGTWTRSEAATTFHPTGHSE